MAIKKRGSIYWYRFEVNGQEYRGSCFTEDRRAAQRFHDDTKTKVWARVHLKQSEKRTWKEALTRWLNEHDDNKTILENEVHGQWWTDQFEKKKIVFLEEITPDVFKEIRDKERLRPKERSGELRAPATVNRKISVLTKVMRSASREYGWLNSSPLFKRLKGEREIDRWLTFEESQRLLVQLKEPFKSMAKFSLAVGFRQANVFELRWSEVDLHRRQITLPGLVMKNNKPFSSPIPQTAMDILLEWKGRDKDFVFIHSDGRPVKARSLENKMWSAAKQRAGVANFRWHDLRHTWASWMVQNGMPLEVLQKLGGWRDFRMVLRYAHHSTEGLAKHSAMIDSVFNRGVVTNSGTHDLKLVVNNR